MRTSDQLVITKALREMAVSSIYSLEDLCFLKRYANLTDFGVRELIEFCMPRALSPFVFVDYFI